MKLFISRNLNLELTIQSLHPLVFKAFFKVIDPILVFDEKKSLLNMNLDQLIQIFVSSLKSLKIVYSGLFQLFQS